MALENEALALHSRKKGKISTGSKVSLCKEEDLSLAYTPGVAEPCKAIAQDPQQVYTYTSKGNMVAVVTDGTAVLGLGDIGPAAALPVMEGKALLLSHLPVSMRFQSVLIQKIPTRLSGQFNCWNQFWGNQSGRYQCARCFEIEEKLKNIMNIPVFHDDQHGTAIVVLAAVINALKVVKKDIAEAKLLINGAGAAGTAIARLLLSVGAQHVVVCDRNGALCAGDSSLNEAKQSLAGMTNKLHLKGTLNDVISDMDVFIGVSGPQVLTKDMVRKMAGEAIVLAMANPVPEIWPKDALEGGARIVGTGRSDFPNQVNNVLAFPGVFRGALEVQAKSITEEMKQAAAFAIAELISVDDLHESNIMPGAFDRRVAPAVAAAVAAAAIQCGAARLKKDPDEIKSQINSDVEMFCRSFGESE